MNESISKNNILTIFKNSRRAVRALTKSREIVRNLAVARSHWPISALSTFSSFVNMLMPLVLVRVLDPSTLGTFKIFFLYLATVPAFTLVSGVSSGLAYWAGRGEEGLRAIRVSGLLFLALSVAAMAIVVGLRIPIARAIGLDPEWVALFGVALSTGIASMFYDDAAIATGRIWTGAIFNSGFELLRTAAVIGVALHFRDLGRIIETHVAAQTLRMVVGYALAYRQGLIRLEWDKRIFRSVLRYALPVSFAFVFGVWLNYSDQIILSNLISRADFAVYVVCCLSVPPLLILEASVTRVLIPQLSASFAKGDSRNAAALYRNAVRELAFILVPAVTGLFVFAEPIIRILFTETYLPGANYLRLYAFWYLTLIVPLDAVARARGEAKWILGNFVAFSLITVAACLALGKLGGAFGVLAGLLLARFASRAYTVQYLARTLKWKLRDFLPVSETIRMATAALIAGGLSWASRPVFRSDVVWFLVGGSFFTLAYFAVNFRLVLRKNPSARKVLMLTPGLHIGGLERMILNLSRGLKRASDWEPQVLAYDFTPGPNGDLVPSFRADGVPVFTFEKPPRFSLKAAVEIAARVRRENVTVIHTHDLGALIYGAIAKCLLLGRVRLVHTQHSFVHLERSWKYRYYERFFTRLADAIVVVSPDTRDSYVRLGVSERKIHLIPNGVEFPETPELERSARVARRESLYRGRPFESRLREFAGDFWILYLARVHGRKGQDHALKLWRDLDPAVRSRAVLLFVGPETEAGAMKRLETQVAEAPNPERVVIAGASFAPQEWVQASDLFLSCSEFEGMPLAPVEAVGSGVPAVLSAIVGHEFLAPYAELYPLTDPARGARSIENAERDSTRSDSELRKRVWEYSGTLRREFTLASMSERYRNLYEAAP